MPTVTPTSPRAPTCFYSQAAVGEMGLSTVRQAVERELTFSKGLQGILIVGEFRSVKSHLKIARADTVEEARLCFRMGAVQGPLGLQCTDPRVCYASSNVTFAQSRVQHKGYCTSDRDALLNADQLSCFYMLFYSRSLFVEILAQHCNR